MGLDTALTHVAPTAHVVAILAFVVELIARGARIVFVARGLGADASSVHVHRRQLAGDAAGALTPSRTGSDPAKLFWLRRGGIDVGTGGALLLAELLLEAACLVVLAVAVASGPHTTRWASVGFVAYAGVVASAGGLVWLLARSTGRKGRDRFLGLPLGARRIATLRALSESMTRRVAELRGLSRRHLAGALAMTALHIAARAAMLPILLVPPDGTSRLATVTPETVLVPLVLLYGTALLPPPGGGGGVEAAFALLLSDRLGGVQVAGTVVWWRLYTFYLGVLVGALLMAWRAARRKGADTQRSREASRPGTTWRAPT